MPQHHLVGDFEIVYCMRLNAISVGGNFLNHDRYSEWSYTLRLIDLLPYVNSRASIRLDRSDYRALRDPLGIVGGFWEMRHTANCDHGNSTTIGLLYGHAKELLDDLEEDVSAGWVRKRVDKIDTTFRGTGIIAKRNKFLPLKWAIHPHHFSDDMLSLIVDTPFLHVTKSKCMWTEAMKFQFPAFDLLRLINDDDNKVATTRPECRGSVTNKACGSSSEPGSNVWMENKDVGNGTR